MPKDSPIVPSLIPFAINPLLKVPKPVGLWKSIFLSIKNFLSSSSDYPLGSLENEFEPIWLAFSNNGWSASSRLSRDFSVKLIAAESLDTKFLEHLDLAHRFICTEFLKLIFLKSNLNISTQEMRERAESFEERLKLAAQTKNFAPQSTLFKEVVAQSIVLETDLKKFEIAQMAALNLSHELQRLSDDLDVAIHFPESDLTAMAQNREYRIKDFELGLGRIHALFGNQS